MIKRENRIEDRNHKEANFISLKALSCTYCDDGNDSMLFANETDENSGVEENSS